MSNSSNIQDPEAFAEPPPSTIDERIAAGISGLHPADGGILPFPKDISNRSLQYLFAGNERKRYEEWLWVGYRATLYKYRSSDGSLINAVVRLDHKDGAAPKIMRPLTYFGKFEGKGDVYGLLSLKRPWPLYGLDRLATRPDTPVLVTEGEKACEAAAALFPDYVCITWMSGAGNVKHAEMLALAGRSIVLWPDNDPPGRAAMRTFAARAFEAGAVSVKIVDVPPEYGPKWDLADEVPATVPEDLGVAHLLATARPVSPSEVAHLNSGAQARAEQRRLLGYQPGYSRVKLEHAATALSLLDADMHGNQWREVARCIFYAFGDEGLAMFDDWSKGSEDKYRKGEPEKLWAAYRAESALRGKSIAWLFRRAGAELAERQSADPGDKPNIKLDEAAVVAAEIEELSENHAVVVRGGTTGVLWENYDPRFGRYTETYLKKRDFTDQHVRSIALASDDDRQTKKGDKRMQQGDLWFTSPWRRSYEGVHFAPGQTLDRRYLNSWRGFAVEPSDDTAGWSKFKDHLRDHVAGGNVEAYEYVLNWLAFAVQHLDKPIGTALVLIGQKGAGKSIVTELFGHLFGQHTFVTSRMEDAIGRFNDRLETTVLLGLEEAVAPQNKSADGTLKDLITRPTLRLEGKFFGVWDAPNHLRIIVTSNNEHVVRADGSERRYAVFEVTNPHQHNPDARRRYFGEMVEQMETGGYAAMLGELLSRDVSGWNAEALPETEALKRQKVLNLANDPVRAYLYERLTDGEYITTGTATVAVRNHRWSQTDVVYVPARDLIDDFLAHAAANGMRGTGHKLALALPRYMPDGFKAVTVRGSGDDSSKETFKAYPFPRLEIARRLFEERTGFKIAREEPEEGS